MSTDPNNANKFHLLLITVCYLALVTIDHVIVCKEVSHAGGNPRLFEEQSMEFHKSMAV